MNRAAVTLALFLGLAAASQAHAAQKIYSYVPADAATRQRIDSGLTFVFDKGLVGMRVKEILATEAKARAALVPVGDKELGALRINGRFRTNEPAAFLNAVVAYFPVEAHRTPGGETVLTGRP